MARNKEKSLNNLKLYFEEIKKYDLLTFEQEKELANKIKQGDKIAFDKMVKCNLRLVVNIAKRYKTPEWQLADLIQEGNIGLIKTVKKYDPEKNVRFSTYASYWIIQSITRSLSNKRRTIRLPHRKEEKLRKINKTINELSQEFNREPTYKEVAQRLDMNERDVLKLKNITEKLISIDADFDNEGYNYNNLINDDNYSPERVLNEADLAEETSSVLEKLPEKERAVIKSRYAFDSNKKHTLKDIADELGISPETVRQIELRASKKIKENFSYLKEYLYC